MCEQGIIIKMHFRQLQSKNEQSGPSQQYENVHIITDSIPVLLDIGY